MEVLSSEYESSAVSDAIGDLTAEINLNLQKAIRSNKLKREEDEEKNKKIAKEIYEFKPKKTDFEQPGQEIVQSIIEDEPFCS